VQETTADHCFASHLKLKKGGLFAFFAALLKHISKSAALSWINPPNVLPSPRQELVPAVAAGRGRFFCAVDALVLARLAELNCSLGTEQPRRMEYLRVTEFGCEAIGKSEPTSRSR
jgi:hypothetical protein